MAAVSSRFVRFGRLCLVIIIAFSHTFLAIKRAKLDRIWKKPAGSRRSGHNARADRQTHGFGPSYMKLLGLDGHSQSNHSRVFTEYELVHKSSKLPEIDGFARLYFRFAFTAYVYLIVKNTILVSLRLKSLEEYRYLDCYLVGRFLFSGRVVSMTNEFTCFLALFRLIWLYLVYRFHDYFRLEFVEFLLSDEEEISCWDTREANCERGLEDEYLNTDLETRQLHEPNRIYSSIFDYRNPFNMKQRLDSGTVVVKEANFRVGRYVDHTMKPLKQEESLEMNCEIFKLRPNRKLNSWTSLTRTSFFLSVGGIFFSYGTVVFFFTTCFPLIASNRGFELTQYICIDWIKQQFESLNDLENGTSIDLAINYKNILPYDNPKLYQKPQPYKEILPSVGGDYVNLNYYHTIRIIVTVFENSFLGLDVCFSFTSKLFMVLLISADVSCYCDAIVKRLERIIEIKRNSSRQKSQKKMFAHPLGKAERKSKRQELINGNPVDLMRAKLDSKRLRSDIYDTQAMTVDMFNLIDNYNRYLSVLMFYLLVFWLSYSAFVSGWIFIPKEDLPKGEWYILHGFATTYMLALILPQSFVRTRCRLIHKLITISMALDEDIAHTKGTWMKLLRFYTPTPLYCFAVLKEVELSKMLAIKLLAWLFSALSVISTFFAPYNAR